MTYKIAQLSNILQDSKLTLSKADGSYIIEYITKTETTKVVIKSYKKMIECWEELTELLLQSALTSDVLKNYNDVK